MRKDLVKYLFLGSKGTIDEFFDRAQKLGVFQFLSVSEQKAHHFPKAIEDLRYALKILHRQAPQKQKIIDLSHAGEIVDQTLVLKKEIENLHEEIRMLGAEIVRVSPLGQFNMEDIQEISKDTKKHVQFFLTRHAKIVDEKLPEGLLFINRDTDLDYYMYIGDAPFSHREFSEIKVRMSLGELKEEKSRLEEISRKSEQELKDLAKYSDFLQDAFFQKMNNLNLQFAKSDIEYYLDEEIFGIEAWVPENQIGEVTALVKGLPVFFEQVLIEEDEFVPTYLENKGFGRVGQDLVEIYDTPSTTDPDPSGWVVGSFAIFFAIIVADACYGCIFALVSLFLWIKFPKAKGIKKRLMKLFTLLSFTTIFWGVMVGSYFSIQLEPTNPLVKVSMLYQVAVHKIEYHLQKHDPTYLEWVKEFPGIEGETDAKQVFEKGVVIKDGEKEFGLMGSLYDGILLELAILIGVLHLSISFLRNLRRNWAGIGWLIAIWGGYLYFPKVLDATTLFNYMNWVPQSIAFPVGEQLLYGGLGLALVLSLIQQRLAGLGAAFKMIEIFADTLSYLRLYALGLASMVLAATFNEIGMKVGYLFGGLIILFGHCINITLGVSAGLIHGLRLNFLEWYHHCFEGGGKKFNPLKLFVRE